MQDARHRQHELGDRRLKLHAVLGRHLVAALHGADRRRQLAAAGVFEALAGSQQGLVADHAEAAHLLHLAFRIGDEPVARDQLRADIAGVLDAGPPNSGKSTLLNALVAREAAIVSDIAGTTRDLIEIPVAFEGIPFLLTDTAGLRDGSSDSIEAIGIERAGKAIADADIVLWLGCEGEGPQHPRLIEVEAKIDAASHTKKSAGALRLSAKTGEGVSDLVGLLVREGREMLPPTDSFALNQRQRYLLRDAALFLSHAATASDPLIMAEELRQARRALDALTGRASTEDMLDALFGRFCIGK